MHIGFWLMIVPLVAVGAMIFLVARLMGGLFGSGREETAEEARMIQEMYNSMARLENRVDVLETLLMEQDQPEDKS